MLFFARKSKRKISSRLSASWSFHLADCFCPIPALHFAEKLRRPASLMVRSGAPPTTPSYQRLRAPPHMARRPVGTLREHGGRGLGVMPRPLAANRHHALCHCKPPFVMIRTSFAGWSFRSSFTCPVVFSGFRAHIHMPNDLATIIANITFRSHRRVKMSSW